MASHVCILQSHADIITMDLYQKNQYNSVFHNDTGLQSTENCTRRSKGPDLTLRDVASKLY